jgi:hypothetical protein
MGDPMEDIEKDLEETTEVDDDEFCDDCRCYHDGECFYKRPPLQVAKMEGQMDDGTKIHVCIDNKWHIGQRARCDRCPTDESTANE